MDEKKRTPKKKIVLDSVGRKKTKDPKGLQDNILANILDVAYSTDLKFRLTSWNHAAEETYGWREHEVLGKSVFEFVGSKFDPEKRRKLTKELLEKGSVAAQIEHTNRFGNVIVFDSITTVLRDKNGKPSGFVGLNRDISERKRLEQILTGNKDELEIRVNERTRELEQSEENYQTLFNSIDEGFCIIDVIFNANEKPIDYCFLKINPAFERQTGLHDAEGKLMRSLAPEHEEHWFQIYGRIALTGKSERFVNEAKALNRWYDVYAFRVGGLESRKVAILFNDITMRKKAEGDLAKAKDELEIKVQERTAELQVSEENYRRIIETANEGIWVAQPDGKTIFVNHRMAEMLGYTTEEMSGKSGMEFLENDEKGMVPETRQELENGSKIGRELKFRRKDGSVLWTIASVSPLFDNRGRHVGNLSMHTDITERKHKEDEIQNLLIAVQQERETLSTLLNAIPDEVWFADINKKFTLANPAALKEFGDAASGVEVEALAQSLEVYRPDGTIRPVEEAPPLRVLAGETVRNQVEMVKTPVKGELRYRQVNAAPVKDAGGKIVGAVSVVRDITESKKMEEQLRQRAEELETVMNVVPVAIWVAHDPACHNITGNQTANRFYEADEGENVSAGPAPGEPVPERRFFRNDKELAAEELPMQEAAARNVDIEGSEFNVLLPSGKSRTLWGSASPLKNEDGQVRGVVAAFLDITDRTLEQEKLKESENRFSKAFHSSPVGLSISRINDGTFIDINQNFSVMFGYSREELIGHKATELNIYDNPIERKEIVRQLEQQGRVLNYEVTARTKAGAEINVLTSAEKIEINGQAHIIWTTIDITDRKKTEQEVVQLNRELRAINECDQIIAHASEEKTFLFEVCRVLCTTAGYRMAWIASIEHDEAKSVRPLAWCGDEGYIAKANITWADTERGRGPAGLAARTGKTHFFQDFASDPAAAPWREAALSQGYRSSIAVPLIDNANTFFGVFSLYSPEPNSFNPAEIRLLEELAANISFGIIALREKIKRQQAEAEISHLASFPELNPNPIIELDFSGNIKYANPAAKRDFPIVTQSKKPEFLIDLFKEINENNKQSITRDIKTGNLWFEQALVYVQTTKSYLLYGRNITTRKEAEDELKQRTIDLEASNKELESFSYSVSHDLRSPLRSITGFSNVLLEDYSDELDEEGKSYLKKISDSGELMGQLMDDLLKLSRVTRTDLKTEKLNLSDMAQKIADDLAKDEPERKVKVKIAPNLITVGDKNLLNLVLQNLLGNAWKYSSKTAEPLIEMGTIENKGKQTYFVRDNGAGFDMAHASKLFQPFQRLHKASEFAGTGVGLATVQRIIRRHGGEVWAESKVDEGATFYFTLG